MDLAKKDDKIVVFGMAYKQDVDDLRESPSVKICKILSEAGFLVYCCEPNAADDEIAGFPNLSLDEALAAGGFFVITLKHSAFLARSGEIKSRPHLDCVGL